jgi:hypothetical protein
MLLKASLAVSGSHLVRNNDINIFKTENELELDLKGHKLQNFG